MTLENKLSEPNPSSESIKINLGKRSAESADNIPSKLNAGEDKDQPAKPVVQNRIPIATNPNKKLASMSINPIKMKLSVAKSVKEAENTQQVKPSLKVASIFNVDDESDEEEMPLEARIKMRNKGRDTPTSSGPNSYGKNKYGFTDRTALLNKQNQNLLDALSEDNERK